MCECVYCLSSVRTHWYGIDYNCESIGQRRLFCFFFNILHNWTSHMDLFIVVNQTSILHVIVIFILRPKTHTFNRIEKRQIYYSNCYAWLLSCRKWLRMCESVSVSTLLIRHSGAENECIVFNLLYIANVISLLFCTNLYNNFSAFLSFHFRDWFVDFCVVLRNEKKTQYLREYVLLVKARLWGNL